MDLKRINGLGVTVVMKLLTEIGPDVSRLATVKHFCAWLGLCPGTKISGGKVLSSETKRSANRARQSLKLAAQALCRSDSALGAFYRRLCGRMEKPRANEVSPRSSVGPLRSDSRSTLWRWLHEQPSSVLFLVSSVDPGAQVSLRQKPAVGRSTGAHGATSWHRPGRKHWPPVRTPPTRAGGKAAPDAA
jgi:Transposase IS116/IS110/IS902 family